MAIVTYINLYCQPGKWQKAYEVLQAIRLRYPVGLTLALVESGVAITSQFTAIAIEVDNLEEVVGQVAAAAKPDEVNMTTTTSGTYLSIPLVLGFNILITKP